MTIQHDEQAQSGPDLSPKQAAADDNKVPLYMRDDVSDTSQPEEDEAQEPSIEVNDEEENNIKLSTQIALEPHKAIDQSKAGESSKTGIMGLFRKRNTRVGQVEVDPDIDYADFKKDGPGLSSRATITEDGTINVWVDLKKALPDLHKDYARPVKEYATDPLTSDNCPPLNIVIFIVGSRGDVQPYLSLALELIKSNGHRVRIATHPDFKEFVLNSNRALKGLKGKTGQDLEGRLEYFDAGGDPKSLMAYMVKNPGLLPGIEAITSGDIGSKRRMTGELLSGFFLSTFSPDPISQKPFAADAIISNPPAFAHVHIAEGLGLPLHLSFTMPWSPSTQFHHPLVNVKKSNAEKGLTNYLTFSFADMMTWQGLGDVINNFRIHTLGLEALSARSGPAVVERLKIPWTYCWSDGLIPKPYDWKEHIDISGFYFLEGDSDFKPDQELVDFMKAGDPPVYIGFGSVPVEDPTAMTQILLDAAEKAGVRALVSAGWGGLGGANVPKNVFILKGNIPHDWLFAENRVSAVCHHGGAGTTAIGLRNGLPTIVVPFFGDQQFWGDMIHEAGAGPAPIPHKTLTSDNLAAALKVALSPDAKKAAQVMGDKIRSERGEVKGVKSFHSHLPLKTMRCDIDPTRIAYWWSPELLLRLSGAVAGALVEKGKITFDKLEPLRAKEYQSRHRASDPVTGGSIAVLTMVANHYSGIAQLFYAPSKGAVNYATAIPQGLFDLVRSVHEGFAAIPERLGSNVRPQEPVKDFESGLREGGKGLFFGWWDGITGLVTEPIEGGKKEGAIGVLKGMGRSYVNVTARPAAGITGVMTLPLQGAYMALRRKVSGAPKDTLRPPREAMSKSAASELTEGEKEDFLKKFALAVDKTKERKEEYKQKFELFLKNAEEEEEQSKTQEKADEAVLKEKE